MTTREQIEAAIGVAQRLREEAPLVPVAIEGPSPLRAWYAEWVAQGMPPIMVKK